MPEIVAWSAGRVYNLADSGMHPSRPNPPPPRAIFVLFFFVVDRFLQMSTPVAVTSAAVLFSSARSPNSFSLRALFSGQAAFVRPSCSGQCWRKSSVVNGAVSQGHISDRSIFCLWKGWAFSLLCPLLILNSMTSSHLVRQQQLSDLLWLGCCWCHFFPLRVLVMVFPSLNETCLVVQEAPLFGKSVSLLISINSAMGRNPLEYEVSL